jgi:hypothetical protein
MKSKFSDTSAGRAPKLISLLLSPPEPVSFKPSFKEFFNLSTPQKLDLEKQAFTEYAPAGKTVLLFITSTMIKSINQEIWLFTTWVENGTATVPIKPSLFLSAANSLKSKNKFTTLSTKPKDKS